MRLPDITNMKDITINDLTFTIPTAYNELTVAQLRHVGRVIITGTAEAKLRCVYKLLNLGGRLRDRKRWREIKTLPPAWIQTLLYNRTLLGWIFEKGGLTNYPLRKFKWQGRTYHGPKDSILNVTTEEITLGYTYFKNYAKTNDYAQLDRLIALVYRPANPFNFLLQWRESYTGDVRMPLNGYNFEKRIKRFATLDKETKVTIFMQWAGAWEVFENRPENKYIFPKSAPADDSVRVDNNQPDPYMWQKVMLRMAQSGEFGTLQQIQKMHKDWFFLNMARNWEEYMEKKDAMSKR